MATCKKWLCTIPNQLAMLLNPFTKLPFKKSLVAREFEKPWYDLPPPRPLGDNECSTPMKTLKVLTKQFDDGQCAICLNDPQINKSFPPCGHVFCCECLVRWCGMKLECPTCKQGFHRFRHDNGEEEYDALGHYLSITNDRELRFKIKFWKNVCFYKAYLRRRKRIEDGLLREAESYVDVGYIDSDFLIENVPSWVMSAAKTYTSENFI